MENEQEFFNAPVKHIFIMYMPGHAGNLLCRLFSLSPETLPHAPLEQIEYCIARPTEIPILSPRLETYLFSKALNYSSWQQFHRAWPTFLDWDKLFYWNGVLESKFSKVIHAIHPNELEQEQDRIDTIKYKEFYYVDIDLYKYQSWVSNAQVKLKATPRRGEYERFVHYSNKYKMLPINLTCLLDSDDNFLEEYLRITQLMNITPVVNEAVALFNDWKKIRGPDAG